MSSVLLPFPPTYAKAPADKRWEGGGGRVTQRLLLCHPHFTSAAPNITTGTGSIPPSIINIFLISPTLRFVCLFIIPFSSSYSLIFFYPSALYLLGVVCAIHIIKYPPEIIGVTSFPEPACLCFFSSNTPPYIYSIKLYNPEICQHFARIKSEHNSYGSFEIPKILHYAHHFQN